MDEGEIRITGEAVDHAGDARAEEVVVRHGATWPELGAIAAVVAGAVVARWAMLGEKKGGKAGRRFRRQGLGR